jgi:hypothetical protein
MKALCCSCSRVLAGLLALACLLCLFPVQAEVMTISTLYTQAITVTNAVHPLWTPVQHYRGMTFVVCPDVHLRPVVTQIDRQGKVTSVFLDPETNPVYTATPDGHNRFTMGIDKNGYLHVMGDMHGYAPWASTYVARYQRQSILYWKSNKALEVTGGFSFCGGLNATTRLPGVEWGGDSRFFNDRNGELYFSSRVRAFEGSSLGGSEPFIAYGLYLYNTTNGLWTALGGSPAYAVPGAAKNFNDVLYWEYTLSFEAYQCQPRFDNNNRLHFAIAGNTAGTIGNGLIYAASDDGGLTWKKANGAGIPGLPLRGKDGEPCQGDLIVRAKNVAQQAPVYIDVNGKLNVAGWTWAAAQWTNASAGYGLLGPDNMLTAEGGSVLRRSTAIGERSTSFDTGFGQVFSTSELGLQTEGAIYGIGLPPGFNFPTATNMSVYKATFTAGGDESKPPAAPKVFFAQGEDTRAWLSWTVPDRARSYNVKRGTAKDGPYMTIATHVTNSGDYLDPARVNGTTYYYVVSAVNSAGEGPDSAPVSITPADPPLAPIIQSVSGGNGHMVLRWIPLWPNAVSYQVKRAAVSGGPYATIALRVVGLSYTNIGLANDTHYYYVVTASDATGRESPHSREMSGAPFRWRPILKYRSIGYDPAIQGCASASGDNPPRETAAQAFDGNSTGKWLTMANRCWLQYQFTNGVTWAVTRYQLVSGQDGPERDPKDWQLLGSNDGTHWSTLDTRIGQTFAARTSTNTYTFDNSVPCAYYRLNITANRGNGITQLAELILWADGDILGKGQ